ncbi:MAG: MucR family transcriptional regulator [Acetobacteraceae bacterium]
MADRITRLTAEVVAAYVAGQAVSADVVPRLIRRVHQSLRNLPAALPASRQVPAPVRHAISAKPADVLPDRLICLACRLPAKILKRHLAAVHGLTPERYRKMFGLAADSPMVAPGYARLRSELAKQSRLGHRR